MGMEGK
ncbi:hypothetical protein LINGRAHAP2_LOCUS37554 [Linum grandiflorum]